VTHFGAAASLFVRGNAQTLLRFDFSRLPDGTSGDAVAKATLKPADELLIRGSQVRFLPGAP
jgi:hypothetical protein